MREHDDEPVRGLPEALPAGERLLWQGAPDWRAFARQAFHLRKLAVYFGLALAWNAVSMTTDGADFATVALATARFLGLAVFALALLAGFGWLVARTTVYSITDRRVVVRFGVALSMTVNIPFRVIEQASARRHADGTGDVVLTLVKGHNLAYLVMWPHVRPWRFARAMPMLRALPDGEAAAEVLAGTLAAYAYPIATERSAVAGGVQAPASAAA